MKTLLIAVISMVMVLMGGPAFAGSSRGATYQGYSSGPITGTSIIDARGGVIYNITINATAANAIISIYDQPTLPIDALAPYYETAIYEVETATSGNSATVDFSTAPLNTFNGIVATVSNGVGYLNYQP